MTSFRRAIPDFQTANPLYVGAQILVYEVDDDGNSTGELATLYAGPRGSQTLSNPQVLDGDGKWERVPYFETPIQMSVVSTRVGSHSTGVVQPFGNWRSTWAPGVTYLACDFMQYGDDDFPNIYAVADTYTSRATIAADIAAGDLVLIVDCAALVNMRDAAQEFSVLYLGAKTSSVSVPLPTVDNDGGTLNTGAMLFHTNVARFKIWSGIAWIDPAVLAHTHAIGEVTALQANLDALALAIFNAGNATTAEAAARAAADTALTTALATANSNMGLVKLGTGSVSNVASVDIPLSTDYDSFHVVVSYFYTHTAGNILVARLGYPAIQVTGYGFVQLYDIGGTPTRGFASSPIAGTTRIPLSDESDGSGWGAGHIDIDNRAGVAGPIVQALFSGKRAGQMTRSDVSGEHNAPSAATVLQLLASAGNITLKWTAYGRKR